MTKISKEAKELVDELDRISYKHGSLRNVGMNPERENARGKLIDYIAELKYIKRKQRMSDDLELFKELVESKEWITARTYVKTAPHEYVLRKMYISEEFNFMVHFIRVNGFTARFGRGKPLRYLIFGEHYYWTMGDEVGKTIVLNRALLNNYTLEEGNRWVLKEGVISDEDIY